jgi:hypothetical protein
MPGQITLFSKKIFSYKNAAIILFAGLFLLVIFTFQDYGISWDEHFHLTYGRYLIDYYKGLLTGQADLRATQYENLYLYGGAYDLSAAILGKLIRYFAPTGEVEVHHLINGLVGLLGILGAWATARLLAGDTAAFWSVLFLAAVPTYYGHFFFNPKDIPFATGYIWSLYFMLRLLKNSQKTDWKGLLLFSALVGLTSGIRVAGLILLGYYGLAVIWNYLAAYGLRTPVRYQVIRDQIVFPVAVTSIISWCIMLTFWPWAQSNPILNPFRALSGIPFGDGPLVVLYRGQFLPTNRLPLDYIFGYFAVQLPEIVLVLLLIGFAMLVYSILKSKNKFSPPRFKILGCCILVMAVAIPLVVAILGQTILYDGIRHFLFVIPPLACLCGIIFQSLIFRMDQHRRTWAIVAQVVVGIYLVYHLSIIIRLHPYEYTYFNALAGGLPGASQRYETEYWGTAGSEAAKWLATYLKENHKEGDKVNVYACNDLSSVVYYLPDNVRLVNSPDKAEYFIGGIRNFCYDEISGEEIYSITRLGVPLTIIKIPDHRAP